MTTKAPITGYYYDPALGYQEALHVLRSDGTSECYATGPYIEEAVAEMVTGGVPLIDVTIDASTAPQWKLSLGLDGGYVRYPSAWTEEREKNRVVVLAHNDTEARRITVLLDRSQWGKSGFEFAGPTALVVEVPSWLHDGVKEGHPGTWWCDRVVPEDHTKLLDPVEVVTDPARIRELFPPAQYPWFDFDGYLS